VVSKNLPTYKLSRMQEKRHELAVKRLSQGLDKVIGAIFQSELPAGSDLMERLAES
jgi:hypothetical protein